MNERHPATEREPGLFQGTWRAVAFEADGSPVAPQQYQDARLVIAGDRFTLWNPLPDAEQRVEGTFRVDPSKAPKELDLHLDGGKTVREVYELEGDTLRVCYPVRGGDRPTSLEAGPGSGLALVVYRRE